MLFMILFYLQHWHIYIKLIVLEPEILNEINLDCNSYICFIFYSHKTQDVFIKYNIYLLLVSKLIIYLTESLSYFLPIDNSESKSDIEIINDIRNQFQSKYLSEWYSLKKLSVYCTFFCFPFF